MPDAKLTLKLDRDVIAAGKRLARERGTSLSRMIESLLATEAESSPLSGEHFYKTYEEDGKIYIKNPWGLKVEEPSWYKDLKGEVRADYDIKDYILERYG